VNVGACADSRTGIASAVSKTAAVKHVNVLDVMLPALV
jgi:predicted amino acid-binding ACT domain protein